MMKPNITPVGTFQRITSTAPLRAETREAIQNTVLQFYIQNSQPEDDAEGLTACYERLSQEDKLDGESNSIINQDGICQGQILPNIQNALCPSTKGNFTF